VDHKKAISTSGAQSETLAIKTVGWGLSGPKAIVAQRLFDAVSQGATHGTRAGTGQEFSDSLVCKYNPRQFWKLFLQTDPAMTTDEVLNALNRYTKDCKDGDRETATKLGITCLILGDWLSGRTRPQKGALARLAGFLRRTGYL
jgi:hypothetical protein